MLAARERVVGEGHVRSYENIVLDSKSIPELHARFDSDPVADHHVVLDEDVGADIAVGTDAGIGEDDDELPDAGSEADDGRLYVGEWMNFHAEILMACL